MFIPPISFTLICHPNKIWWRVNLIKLLIMHFSIASFYFPPLRHKYCLIKTRNVAGTERCQTSYGLRHICHCCQHSRTRRYLLSLLNSCGISLCCRLAASATAVLLSGTKQPQDPQLWHSRRFADVTTWPAVPQSRLGDPCTHVPAGVRYRW